MSRKLQTFVDVGCRQKRCGPTLVDFHLTVKTAFTSAAHAEKTPKNMSEGADFYRFLSFVRRVQDSLVSACFDVFLSLKCFKLKFKDTKGRLNGD